MGSKRQHSDSVKHDSVKHVSARDASRPPVGGPDDGPPVFHRHHAGAAKKHQQKPESISWIKKRARTIERRLKTGHDLPATVENEMRRELAHHKQRIQETEAKRKQAKMIKKYHMVRFHGAILIRLDARRARPC